MDNLRALLRHAQESQTAIGHFNVVDLVLLKAVFTSAQQLNVPVLVGVSEAERDFVGVRQIAALVRSLREEFDFPIFLNADHTHSLEKAVAAAQAGFDMVGFDLSALPLEENVRETRQAVADLKSLSPGILIEGEIGDIGTGSQVREDSPGRSKILTTPAEAKEFVAATGIDVLAPAVGNAHGMTPGMVQGDKKKRLDIERIAEIKQATGIPLTLHGGSGTDDGDFRRAILAGINIVHINTELRVAWRRGLEDGLRQNPGEVVPYRILPFAVEAIRKVVEARLELFSRS